MDKVSHFHIERRARSTLRLTGYGAAPAFAAQHEHTQRLPVLA
jgi:hypothetical protein